MATYYSYFPTVVHTDETIRNIMLRTKASDYVRANPKVFLPYVVEDDLRAEDVAAFYYGSMEYTWLIYWANNIIDPYTDWVMNDENFHRYLHQKYLPAVERFYVDNDYVDADYVEERDITEQDVIEFTQNSTIYENIVEFRMYEDETATMSPETFYLMANLQTGPGAPDTLTRDDGVTALQAGDLFLDESLGQYYSWDGATWNTADQVVIQYIKHVEWYPVRYYDWEVERNENNRHIEMIDNRYLGQVVSELKATLK